MGSIFLKSGLEKDDRRNLNSRYHKPAFAHRSPAAEFSCPETGNYGNKVLRAVSSMEERDGSFLPVLSGINRQDSI